MERNWLQGRSAKTMQQLGEPEPAKFGWLPRSSWHETGLKPERKTEALLSGSQSVSQTDPQ